VQVTLPYPPPLPLHRRINLVLSQKKSGCSPFSTRLSLSSSLRRRRVFEVLVHHRVRSLISISFVARATCWAPFFFDVFAFLVFKFTGCNHSTIARLRDQLQRVYLNSKLCKGNSNNPAITEPCPAVCPADRRARADGDRRRGDLCLSVRQAAL
jgi:hypothetical protein